MIEVLGYGWNNRHYPLELNDDMALLEVVENHSGQMRLFIIGPREHLDLEKLVRKMLKADYNSSGYAVKRLAVGPAMGGNNYAAIRTMDHIEETKFHTPEHAKRVLDECCAVWTHGDYYFDIED